MFDWDDIRHFLAVAQDGSTFAAARRLRVSQTTVARRLTGLEASTGLKLFDRQPSGYVLTPAGEGLLEQARAMETAAQAVEQTVAAQARAYSGTVRLTTLDIYAFAMLVPLLHDLRSAYPDIRIELDLSEEPRDLAAGQADIALRACSAPNGAGLVGRRMGDDCWAVYCSRGYAAEHGMPASLEDLTGHRVIGGGGTAVWTVYKRWLESYGLAGAVSLQVDTAAGLLSAVRAGAGVAVLPMLVVYDDPDLLLCLPPSSGRVHQLWLLTHERLRHTPRVRVVMDFLATRLSRRARAAERETRTAA